VVVGRRAFEMLFTEGNKNAEKKNGRNEISENIGYFLFVFSEGGHGRDYLHRLRCMHICIEYYIIINT
jgi:hypothetical protein